VPRSQLRRLLPLLGRTVVLPDRGVDCSPRDSDRQYFDGSLEKRVMSVNSRPQRRNRLYYSIVTVNRAPDNTNLHRNGRP
jgi:hypothetical protein